MLRAWYSTLGRKWNKDDNIKFLVAYSKHGANFDKIYEEFKAFPAAFIREKLSNIKPKQSSLFTVKDDILLYKLITENDKNDSYTKFASRINRSVQTIRNRVHYFIYPFYRYYGDKALSILEKMDQEGVKYSFGNRSGFLGPWTEHEDKILKRVYRLVGGPRWTLIAKDLPGRTPLEISLRAQKIIPWNPTPKELDDALKAYAEFKNLPCPFKEIQKKLFPDKQVHQIRELVLNNISKSKSSIFTIQEQREISKGVKEAGKIFLRHLPLWQKYKWPWYERPDQENAVWSTEVDQTILEMKKSGKSIQEIKEKLNQLFYEPAGSFKKPSTKKVNALFTAKEVMSRYSRLNRFPRLDIIVDSEWTRKEEALLKKMVQEGHEFHAIAQKLNFKTQLMCKIKYDELGKKTD